MTSKRSTFKTKPITTYKSYTVAQLSSTISQLRKQCISTSKTGTTQQCGAIIREIKKVATVMRSKTVEQITAKIKELKTQMAKNLGVKVSHPKASSTVVKRLTAKINQINACPKVSTLTTFCTGVKLTSYKNPVVRATKRTTITKSKTSHVHHAKYKKQTNALAREIHKLTKRNSFMRRLVNQFRKKVAKLQRSYKAPHAKPRWNVVNSKGVSNIVRFTRGTGTTNWGKGGTQRRAG